MSRQLRWGILSTGNIAGQFANGVSKSARNAVVAVGSRRSEGAVVFAQAHQIPRSHGSYESLLADDQVDAVYNALPNSMHHEWTLKALAAGKHVLCEKPLAVNEPQAIEMFDQADRTGLRLAEAFMYRSHPQHSAVLKAVSDGTIGKLQFIRTSFCFLTRKVDGNIRFNKELAGGALMDIGCYCVNFSRQFAGAEPVTTTPHARFHSTGVDVFTAGAMTFPDGVLATFACGMDTQADNTAMLCGSEGYIEIPVPWKPPTTEAVFHISRGIPPKMDAVISAAGTAAAAAIVPTPAGAPSETIRVAVNGELYGFEADDFAATVLDGAAPRVSRADTLGNMRVLDQLRRQIGLRFSSDS